MRKLAYLVGGGGLALAARALLPRVLLLQFSGPVARLNEGDYADLLDKYADDFVLHFPVGPHRWSGDWVGKAGMERFLRNFTAAGVKGEIVTLATSGPAWALTIWARFDDHADGADGTRLYENSTVLVLRTRWGKVVEQHDFFVDTARLVDFDRALEERGVEAVPKQ